MAKALMYGAGNIGRGFIGQLFSLSGYEVTFVDVNEEVVNKLNSDRSYPINTVSDDSNVESWVSNVQAVNGRDQDAVSAAICEADVMATAVGVGVLPHIVKAIAAGLTKRWQSGNLSPLNIIICENLIDANIYLAKLIAQELDETNRAYLDQRVGFVEASVGRMVPIMTEDMQNGNILRVYVEPYCELPVDKDGFRGDIPAIKNMIPARPFEYYIQRKLFLHNMGHALAAYLGLTRGYTYIWEAILDPDIEKVCRSAMMSSALALSKEHDISLKETEDFALDLLNRFKNRQLGDTIARVGRDLSRKLSPNDRLVGAFNLCMKQGVNPIGISIGIVAALKSSQIWEPDLLTDVPVEGLSQSIDTLLQDL